MSRHFSLEERRGSDAAQLSAWKSLRERSHAVRGCMTNIQVAHESLALEWDRVSGRLLGKAAVCEDSEISFMMRPVSRVTNTRLRVLNLFMGKTTVIKVTCTSTRDTPGQ